MTTPDPIEDDQNWQRRQYPDGLCVEAKVVQSKGRIIVTELRMSRSDRSLTTADMRLVKFDQWKAEALAKLMPPQSVRPPLTRPDGTDPDGFSKRVAEAYLEAALAGLSPATSLALEAGVPIGTVRSWFREARLRGYMPAVRPAIARGGDA